MRSQKVSMVQIALEIKVFAECFIRVFWKYFSQLYQFKECLDFFTQSLVLVVRDWPDISEFVLGVRLLIL